MSSSLESWALTADSSLNYEEWFLITPGRLSLEVKWSIPYVINNLSRANVTLKLIDAPSSSSATLTTDSTGYLTYSPTNAQKQEGTYSFNVSSENNYHIIMTVRCFDTNSSVMRSFTAFKTVIIHDIAAPIIKESETYQTPSSLCVKLEPHNIDLLSMVHFTLLITPINRRVVIPSVKSYSYSPNEENLYIFDNIPPNMLCEVAAQYEDEYETLSLMSSPVFFRSNEFIPLSSIDVQYINKGIRLIITNNSITYYTGALAPLIYQLRAYNSASELQLEKIINFSSVTSFINDVATVDLDISFFENKFSMNEIASISLSISNLQGSIGFCVPIQVLMTQNLEPINIISLNENNLDILSNAFKLNYSYNIPDLLQSIVTSYIVKLNIHEIDVDKIEIETGNQMIIPDYPSGALFPFSLFNWVSVEKYFKAFLTVSWQISLNNKTYSMTTGSQSTNVINLYGRHFQQDITQPLVLSAFQFSNNVIRLNFANVGNEFTYLTSNVEYSINNGITWEPASNTTSHDYSVPSLEMGRETTIIARNKTVAVSGNNNVSHPIDYIIPIQLGTTSNSVTVRTTGIPLVPVIKKIVAGYQEVFITVVKPTENELQGGILTDVMCINKAGVTANDFVYVAEDDEYQAVMVVGLQAYKTQNLSFKTQTVNKYNSNLTYNSTQVNKTVMAYGPKIAPIYNTVSLAQYKEVEEGLAIYFNKSTAYPSNLQNAYGNLALGLLDLCIKTEYKLSSDPDIDASWKPTSKLVSSLPPSANPVEATPYITAYNKDASGTLIVDSAIREAIKNVPINLRYILQIESKNMGDQENFTIYSDPVNINNSFQILVDFLYPIYTYKPNAELKNVTSDGFDITVKFNTNNYSGYKKQFYVYLSAILPDNSVKDIQITRTREPNVTEETFIFKTDLATTQSLNSNSVYVSSGFPISYENKYAIRYLADPLFYNFKKLVTDTSAYSLVEDNNLIGESWNNFISNAYIFNHNAKIPLQVKYLTDYKFKLYLNEKSILATTVDRTRLLTLLMQDSNGNITHSEVDITSTVTLEGDGRYSYTLSSFDPIVTNVAIVVSYKITDSLFGTIYDMDSQTVQVCPVTTVGQVGSFDVKCDFNASSNRLASLSWTAPPAAKIGSGTIKYSVYIGSGAAVDVGTNLSYSVITNAAIGSQLLVKVLPRLEIGNETLVTNSDMTSKYIHVFNKEASQITNAVIGNSEVTIYYTSPNTGLLSPTSYLVSNEIIYKLFNEDDSLALSNELYSGSSININNLYNGEKYEAWVKTTWTDPNTNINFVLTSNRVNFRPYIKASAVTNLAVNTVLHTNTYTWDVPAEIGGLEIIRYDYKIKRTNISNNNFTIETNSTVNNYLVYSQADSNILIAFDVKAITKRLATTFYSESDIVGTEITPIESIGYSSDIFNAVQNLVANQNVISFTPLLLSDTLLTVDSYYLSVVDSSGNEVYSDEHSNASYIVPYLINGSKYTATVNANIRHPYKTALLKTASSSVDVVIFTRPLPISSVVVSLVSKKLSLIIKPSLGDPNNSKFPYEYTLVIKNSRSEIIQSSINILPDPINLLFDLSSLIEDNETITLLVRTQFVDPNVSTVIQTSDIFTTQIQNTVINTTALSNLLVKLRQGQILDVFWNSTNTVTTHTVVFSVKNNNVMQELSRTVVNGGIETLQLQFPAGTAGKTFTIAVNNEVGEILSTALMNVGSPTMSNFVFSQSQNKIGLVFNTGGDTYSSISYYVTNGVGDIYQIVDPIRLENLAPDTKYILCFTSPVSDPIIIIAVISNSNGMNMYPRPISYTNIDITTQSGNAYADEVILR